MDEKSLYLLAQFDDETEEMLSACYAELVQQGFVGKQTKDIPYHFTLGCFDCCHEENLVSELEKICSTTKIIDIRLDHLGLFGLKVLFAEPNMNFELLSLQKAFFDGCGNGYHPWTAHATILLDEPDNIIKALPIVADKFKPTHARITSVGLYEFFPKRFIKKCVLCP